MHTLLLTNNVSADEFQVNSLTQGNQAEPSVDFSGNGNTLIAWCGPWFDSDEQDIIARLFDPNGIALTEEIIVNTMLTGVQQKKPKFEKNEQ